MAPERQSVMKKLLAAGAVFGGVILGTTSTASAHVHQIETPGGQTVILPCEPFHGDAPGASENAHPLHDRLHKGPGQDRNAVTVSAVPGASCESR